MSHPFQHALWIAPSEQSASPILSRRFHLKKAARAELFITGLGYFEATLNGVRLGDEYFQPVVSDYEPRALAKITYPCRDTFTHRIYYRVFDVAHLLRDGENELTVQLGGGWYVQDERIAEGEMSYGDRVKCLYALHADGTIIASDGSERWQDSMIVKSNLFLGERHDPTARRRSGQVITLPAPDSELTEQLGAPDRLTRILRPKLLGEIGGRKVYDAGENISGIARIHTQQGYCGEVQLRFAENLNADGSLNFDTTGANYTCKSGEKQIMADTFVCDGSIRAFEPKFVWHAFRYFDATGEFDRAEVLVIHADTPCTAAFDSDSEGLNFLFDAFIRTQLNNMHGSIPSDCPHRERLGYTGDGQIAAPAAMLLLDSREFYRKWIRDILDCQDPDTGHVQHTAPFQGGGGGPGGWGCAIILAPYYFWRQWGETEMLRQCYGPMKRWLSYLLDHSADNLVVSEAESGWCLGDWCTLAPISLPEPLVNTFYLVKCLRILCEVAELLGECQDIPSFRAQEQASLDAIRRAYYHEETGRYCQGIQGADAYAAALGLQDAAVSAEYYDRLGHFDTGFLGTDVLCELLFESGYADIAYKCISSEAPGGFLHMKRRGATTIWENWDGSGSHDHPMFGASVRQLFQGILGIRQPKGGCGWRLAEIAPQLPADMNRAQGSILTPRGRISVDLKREGNGIRMAVSIPENMEATLFGIKLNPGKTVILR